MSDSRRRHVFLLPWPLAGVGGVNGVVRNLAREFSESGPLRPLVVETHGEPAGRESPAPNQEVETFRMTLLSPYDERHPLRALISFCVRAPFLLFSLRAFCLDRRVDVLNPHFVGVDHFCLVLLKRLGLFSGRVLLSFHGSDIRHMIQSKGIERWFSRLTVRWADYLVPCSEGLRDEVLLFAPECSRRIVPVQNGIDVDLFRRLSAAEFEFPAPFAARPRLLNIGAFEYKKAHDVLLRAFSLLRQSHPLAALVVAGQSRSLFEATQRLVSELKLDADVLLYRDLPYERAASLIGCCDLFVLSSRWEMGRYGEGLAMVLLEAAAAGKPVVTTLSCGVAELIEDGETGWIVPPEDPGSLAAAIKEALDHPQEAARRASNLHQLVRRKFTWKKAHERYLELAETGESRRQ